MTIPRPETALRWELGPEGHDEVAEDPADDVEVTLRPRHRLRSPADLLRLLVSIGLLGLGLAVATWGRETVRGLEADVLVLYAGLPDRVEEAFTGLMWLLAGALPLLAVVVLLLRRRPGLAMTVVVSANVASLLVAALDGWLDDHGVLAAVESRLDRQGDVSIGDVAGSPMVASTVAIVVVTSPWLSQRWRHVLWGGVALLTLVRVASAGPPLDIIVAFAVGLAVGSLALLALGTPSPDPDERTLVNLVRSVADPTRIIQQTSSPLSYLVETRSGTRFDLRLRTSYDRSADLLERLWRYLRLRSRETDRPFNTLGRSVEHEALALTMAAKAGARVHEVHALVRAGDGNVGLVLGHVSAEPVGAHDRLGPTVLTDLWHQVSALHGARIAHRSLSVHQVTVTADNCVVLDGLGQARLAATDHDLALDTAQLLVDTALHTGSASALEVALASVGPDPVAAALPFLQPLALPDATRRSLRGNKGVLDELRRGIQEATEVESPPLERLDRIRPRTALSIVALAAAFYALLPQLARAGDMAGDMEQAHWWWLIPVLVGSAATYVGATAAFIATAPGPVRVWAVWRLQVASSFLSQIAPANAGGLAGAVRFLQRAGYEPGAATASVALNNLGGIAVHLTLMVGFLAWTGTSGIGWFSLPDANLVLLAVAVAASLVGVVGLVRPLRVRVSRPLSRYIGDAATTLAGVMTDPRRLLGLLGGSAGITLTYMLTLAASVQAFGGGLSLPQIGAAYLVATALASTAPTPGGLGAIEAALIAGLTGFGLPDTTAISAVLMFRLATFWLPMLPGWLLFHQMQRHEEL